VRIVYLGTPDDAVAPLRALVDAGHDIAFVVTQPDRRRSRGSAVVPSAVKRAAIDLGLEVLTPQRAAEITDRVRASGAECGVVVAFGQLLPEPLLEAIPGGFVNLHFSLLPRWRGAAPVERAILAGDPETGVCLMRIEPQLDTGPVYAREVVPIAPDDTAGALRERLVEAGTRMLVERLPTIATAVPEAQAGEPSYAEKLGVDEFRLDPSRPAADLLRVVRAGTPRPGAWCTVKGRRLKVWAAHLGVPEAVASGTVTVEAHLGTVDGVLVLDEVQPEGKKTMSGRAWRAGLRGDAHVDEGDSRGRGGPEGSG